MKNLASAALIGLLFWGSTANAALIDFELLGTVELADPDNIFELAEYDEVIVYGTFDHDSLTGIGEETVEFGDGSGNTMELLLGAVILYETDDIDYQYGYFPTLNFYDGEFEGLDYIAYIEDDYGNENFFESYIDDYDAPLFEGGYIDEYGDFYGISGYWDYYDEYPAVPVPAAVWLFGSGLLGLAGVARRKAA